ncbi:hypothetical protein NML43_14110 [Rhodopseudomonas palustris]|jgi:hypothetical protein|uniref:hypothetical protein n=1 Tax=Rhodopseudomonas TaxID=1073 RepID=UPI0006B940C7|nr:MULTISPECIES: hypothetical protein [Rhodopseudomonas]KPG00490.1 hypothetical protein IP86_06645 [Rhodopseudomonas sp. AAP120]MCP9628225.1 hypothetical protein [Rhodopseudomonas palustris]
MSQAVASSAYIIEVHSRAAGIVVRDGRGYRFHAAADDFTALDGQDFRSAGDAHKAALRLVESLRPSRGLKLGVA